MTEQSNAEIRLEVETARPPTSRCKRVIATMEEAARRYPGQVRLVVYEWGSPWPERPTPGFQSYGKDARVPKSFVDGKCMEIGQEPLLSDVIAAIEERLGQLKAGQQK